MTGRLVVALVFVTLASLSYGTPQLEQLALDLERDIAIVSSHPQARHVHSHEHKRDIIDLERAVEQDNELEEGGSQEGGSQGSLSLAAAIDKPVKLAANPETHRKLQDVLVKAACRGYPGTDLVTAINALKLGPGSSASDRASALTSAGEGSGSGSTFDAQSAQSVLVQFLKPAEGYKSDPTWKSLDFILKNKGTFRLKKRDIELSEQQHANLKREKDELERRWILENKQNPLTLLRSLMSGQSSEKPDTRSQSSSMGWNEGKQGQFSAFLTSAQARNIDEIPDIVATDGQLEGWLKEFQSTWAAHAYAELVYELIKSRSSAHMTSVTAGYQCEGEKSKIEPVSSKEEFDDCKTRAAAAATKAVARLSKEDKDKRNPEYDQPVYVGEVPKKRGTNKDVVAKAIAECDATAEKGNPDTYLTQAADVVEQARKHNYDLNDAGLLGTGPCRQNVKAIKELVVNQCNLDSLPLLLVIQRALNDETPVASTLFNAGCSIQVPKINCVSNEPLG